MRANNDIDNEEFISAEIEENESQLENAKRVRRELDVVLEYTEAEEVFARYGHGQGSEYVIELHYGVKDE